MHYKSPANALSTWLCFPLSGVTIYPTITKEGFLLIFLRQFAIILTISLIGEALSFLIPLPIPASIYGILILLILLISGKLKVESVKAVSSFLIAIMPVMFIPAAVGLMDSFSLLAENLTAYAVILIVSTIAVMAVSGRVTQHVIRKEKEDTPNA